MLMDGRDADEAGEGVEWKVGRSVSLALRTWREGKGAILQV